MKMIKTTSRILIVLTLMSTAVTAQDGRRPADFRGAVQGRVLDNATGNEVGYANVVVRNLPDSSLVDGAMSDENGFFYIPNIHIRLKRAAIQMSEVQVVGDRPVIEFKADKRVINADQFAASLSGTAVEILENVPSIDVDVEGTVTLRGSSNFIVMIDGHPSIFEGSDALDQIPATLIQSIEIITNPSARYDPDGTTGIINIVTK
ncbi:MAG: TonB-dependent receptor plug, partial [Marinimicrobia bacterium 46_47]